MRKYSSNNPALSDKDAKVIGLFIEKEFGGNVTPKKLLDAARSKNSPIHRYFEWDDSKAAELYRLRQSSKFIISIYVEADGDSPVRNYLNVRLDDGKTYLHCDTVAADEDLINQVIESAKEQLLRWKNRYERYCEFFKLEFKVKGKRHVIEKEARSNQ